MRRLKVISDEKSCGVKKTRLRLRTDFDGFGDNL